MNESQRLDSLLSSMDQQIKDLDTAYANEQLTYQI